jgi:hypothetical protein
VAGRDREVGWCRVICDNGETYFFPRHEYEGLAAIVENRKGWVEREDVYGSTRKFRVEDIAAIWDCPSEALRLELLDEANEE